MGDMFGDIFGNMFHGNAGGHSSFYSNGSGFGGFGGQKGYRQQASYRGEDLHADITVGFDEAAFGCDKMIHIQAADSTGVQSLSVHIPAVLTTARACGSGQGTPGLRRRGERRFAVEGTHYAQGRI